ncbi:hypothetical protein PCANB_000452 [Pneumocystis canis]|nr:hypothetical protein PCANB_000452 [Pneumocystis canis]
MTFVITTTQPSTLSIRTMASKTLEEARQRILRQYRAWQRAAPIIVQMYQLDIPISTVRSAIRNAYSEHLYIEDVKTLDILIFRCHAEYQETLNFWKQPTHVMTLLQKYVSLNKTFPLRNNNLHNPLLQDSTQNTSLTKNILKTRETKQGYTRK